MNEVSILIDGLRVNYKIAGSGPAILVLHGWGGSSDSWVKVQEILSQNNYKVICPDLPGFGKSQNPPEAWGIDDYINLILNFTKKVSLDRFFLIGHSFGGGLAGKFTALFPEKIKTLILCDAAVIRKKRYSLRQKLAHFLQKYGNIFFSVPLFEKKIYPWARKIVYKIAGTSDYYLAKGTMKETFKKISEEDLTKFLSRIKAPTLIIWGKKDKTLPSEDGFSMKKIIPNSETKIIDGADHSPHRRTPEELSKIILNFLKSK
ncbi:MAG: hypothetical protein COV62_02400 [Candidatus Nealsonbacteria bacterium CG11_big_fil_rev_8_21_14_0_20_35_11]|uniref:AB hydrolase-1 domain-containing protein n=1 Tax=Candidatus Nealsonbacteria bacterium CG11_big_fil_rev_8_21_14_0_20_35_11 TaxID=1974713 RepID=A0A2H0N1R8_9BACT|nr:MAG: hypothetical protein COV62_02400 [Candidatus Nealsonbacteria bacterium CG11_big_fil_rev_8_21_14_0_20_35_11]